MKKTELVIGILSLREPPENYSQILARIIQQHLFTLWDRSGCRDNKGRLDSSSMDRFPHISGLLSDLAWLMADEVIEDRHVKKILEDAWNTEPEYWSLIGYLADTRILDEAEGDDLKGIVLKVLEDNEKAREDIRNGKKQAIGHLVGQIMKATKGKANPKQASEMIQELA